MPLAAPQYFTSLRNSSSHRLPGAQMAPSIRQNTFGSYRISTGYVRIRAERGSATEGHTDLLNIQKLHTLARNEW